MTETERKVLDRVLSEYLIARKARTAALATIATTRRDDLVGNITVGLAAQSLAAAREAIALTSELTHLLRRF